MGALLQPGQTVREYFTLHFWLSKLVSDRLMRPLFFGATHVHHDLRRHHRCTARWNERCGAFSSNVGKERRHRPPTPQRQANPERAEERAKVPSRTVLPISVGTLRSDPAYLCEKIHKIKTNECCWCDSSERRAASDTAPRLLA